VNVSDDDWPLLITWLMAALRSTGPFPALVLVGEQGSAKTVLSKILRALVDPNPAPVRTAPREERAGVDWYGFTLSFKGVFLEGLEVAFIVLTFGSTQKNIPLAAFGAAVAVVLVGVVGLLARAPLSRVPENTLKFSVGVMLTTFGIFWGAEGAGASWPGSDAAILGVLAFVILLSVTMVALLRRRRTAAVVAA